MHETQRTAAVLAMEGTLGHIFSCVQAVRRAKGATGETASYRDGLGLAAQELATCYDSEPLRVLRFVLRDPAAASRDLPAALLALRAALSREAESPVLSLPAVIAAWDAFTGALAGVGVVIDEAAAGTPFDANRHHAVAATPGSANNTVVETMAPGVIVDGKSIVWAKVRTGDPMPTVAP